MAQISSRAAKISVAAVVAFGDRGMTKLAVASGLSKQMLSFIVNGDREVTDEVYRKVALAIAKEAASMKTMSVRLERMAQQMLRELE
ncbi:hypothetical protein ABIB75_001046 [Bradyrhizobium sp. GM2.2]|uniref:helix-turn-helix domain-containing protein n=1 Tax=unclassified Bradyrhizobium TaxID=2631580 RepID=UPI001FFADFBE|nr:MULTISPECIES: helix-turn-helix domain-containing protein [unclassified Bradyrhizobium]MCK1540363.1 hypothetical protein [Bradyrhizobium sp. 176]MCK1556205.1 hypothetical protein [Bradyrhizobium sp. 171]MCK1574598.1 hypothetical protein [Bradyrhizobium sp. 174]